MRRLDDITDSIDMNLSKLRETVKDGEAWRAAVHGVTKSHDLATQQQQELTLPRDIFTVLGLQKDRIVFRIS